MSPLRTVGKFFLYSGAGFMIFVVIMRFFFPPNPHDPGSLGFDWWGAALACGGTAVVGGLLIVLRTALGGLRYSGRGFFVKKARGTKFLVAGVREAA